MKKLYEELHAINEDRTIDNSQLYQINKSSLISILVANLANKTFMDIATVLKSIGFNKKDYYLSTSGLMSPMWVLNFKGDKLALLNKKEIDDPDAVVGDLALGWL